jgi:hypothetical protein
MGIDRSNALKARDSSVWPWQMTKLSFRYFKTSPKVIQFVEMI